MQGNRLHGKVAVIIGGASGIGQSITNLFLKHGAKVIVAYEQDNRGDYQPFLESLKKEKYHTNVIHVPFDVTSDISDLQKAVDQNANKKLDIMVINASKPNNKDPNILGTNIEQFTRALNVNVHGAFLGAKLAAGYMIQAKKGVILFTSGDALLTTEVCPYAYAMSKHAMVGLAYNLSAELGKQNNIRISYISPNIAAAGTEKKKAAEVTIGAPGNLKEVVVVVEAAENVAEAALNLSSDVVLEDGGSSKTDQPSEKKQRTTTVISAAKTAKFG